MKNLKIVITGGHFTPAKAVLDKISKNKEWQIWYVTKKHAQEEDKSVSVEYLTMKEYNQKVKLLVISPGKLQRYFNYKSVVSLLKIPLGFIQSFYWLVTIQPDLVLSFGGSIALPVCLSSYLLKIPVFTHEQTRSIGLANKIINRIASKIFLTYEDTQVENIQDKSIITGLPLRKSILKVNKSWDIDQKKPLIYFSGGSQGSHSLNLLFVPLISKLVKHFSIIHQCGITLKYNDYQMLKKIRDELPEQDRKSYQPVAYIEEDKLGWVYKKACFVIGRSGGNTVYELAACSLPAIFLPLPWSADNEQTKNAEFFAENNAGIILEQEKITSEKLYSLIIDFYRNINKYQINVKRLKSLIRLDADDQIIREIENICEKN